MTFEGVTNRETHCWALLSENCPIYHGFFCLGFLERNRRKKVDRCPLMENSSTGEKRRREVGEFLPQTLSSGQLRTVLLLQSYFYVFRFVRW